MYEDVSVAAVAEVKRRGHATPRQSLVFGLSQGQNEAVGSG